VEPELDLSIAPEQATPPVTPSERPAFDPLDAFSFIEPMPALAPDTPKAPDPAPSSGPSEPLQPRAQPQPQPQGSNRASRFKIKLPSAG
jgi:hypothetical protein